MPVPPIVWKVGEVSSVPLKIPIAEGWRFAISAAKPIAETRTVCGALPTCS
jgi:hypothetical protein